MKPVFEKDIVITLRLVLPQNLTDLGVYTPSQISKMIGNYNSKNNERN